MFFFGGKEIHIQVGPYGGTGGTDWDDGCHRRIERIFVSYSSRYIGSIQTVYKDFSNNIVIAPRRGPYSYTFEVVHPPPETPITRIDGYFDRTGITYLEFSTNNGKIGSFGSKTGSPFTYKDPRGFAGFHGRSNGIYLVSLGVHVNSCATKYLNPSTSSSSKKESA
ncbi:hypothetical protein LUZ61_000289 [Rhynchospora tenuis]|uniref:Jacalin-type lectin domain-containing protein n=1 Tax=Rhynchospora tenuis TaxID=198213 RepID=A0AAD5ZF67_9POAL|nr:hypothetical protein LUZ61_000289 [Rhynchospora tenuis]